MDSAFINGYVASITDKFGERELRLIRDSLYAYSLNWDIKPMETRVVPAEYQLPVEFKYFMASKKQDGKMSNKSAEQYNLTLGGLLYFCKMPVKDIGTQHIRAYLYETSTNRKTGKPISPYTSNQRKAIIRSFFSWCFANGFITSNPAAILSNERTDGVEPREPFSEEEVEKLKYACKTLRDRAIVETLLATGVRANECINIKRSDINMHDRSICILGKGNKYRTVFFNASAKVALQKYWASLETETNYAFVTLRKPYEQLGKHSLEDRLNKIGKLAGVDKTIPHRFRHTFATRLEERGCPIEVIQELLGHGSIATTTRYAHQNKSRIRAEYNRYIA